MSDSDVSLFIAGLYEPRGPKARRWLEQAESYASGLTADMQAESPFFNTIVAHVVAVSIWETTRGNPSWGRLDVEACVELAGTLPTFEHAGMDCFLTTVSALYVFLTRYGLIAPDDAARINGELDRLVEPIFASFLAEHHKLANAGMAS